MTNFYMLVGLPGSGKSNIARKMKEEQLERANGKGGTITNTGKRYRT